MENAVLARTVLVDVIQGRRLPWTRANRSQSVRT